MSTWVLLRGLMRESRHWGEFTEQFQSAMGTQIVTPDFPGNGRLHAEASPDSVTGMADACRAQLKQLGYEPPYRLLALSLGAMVAVEWSTQHPDELERMVLINTSLAPYNPFYHRLRPANYPALTRFLIDDSIVRRERTILRITSNKARSKQEQSELLDQWARYARECPVTRANILRQLRAAMTYRAPPATPSTPALLLGSRQDHLVNVKCTLALAQRWGCEVRLHSAAGHDLPLDDREWVARQVEDWVAG